jgi:hypothetical protein
VSKLENWSRIERVLMGFVSGCGKVGGVVAVAGSGWVAVGWLKSAWLSDHFECLKLKFGP